MLRNLLTFGIGSMGLWLSIMVFGWIVSGDISIAGYHVNREQQALRFWLSIFILALLCCAVFGVALAIFIQDIY